MSGYIPLLYTSGSTHECVLLMYIEVYSMSNEMEFGVYGRSKVVFSNELDEQLLAMEDGFGDKCYKLYTDGIESSQFIFHEPSEYDRIDNELIDALEVNGIDRTQPMIAHIADTCQFGDYYTIIMCKQFVLSVGYYSAGPCIAHFTLSKWDTEGEYFDPDTLDFMGTSVLATAERGDDGGIDLF